MDQGILVLIFVLSFSVSTKEAGRCGKISNSCGKSSFERSIIFGGDQIFRGPIKIHLDISIDVGGTGRYHHCRKLRHHPKCKFLRQRCRRFCHHRHCKYGNHHHMIPGLKPRAIIGHHHRAIISSEHRVIHGRYHRWLHRYKSRMIRLNHNRIHNRRLVTYNHHSRFYHRDLTRLHQYKKHLFMLNSDHSISRFYHNHKNCLHQNHKRWMKYSKRHIRRFSKYRHLHVKRFHHQHILQRNKQQKRWLHSHHHLIRMFHQYHKLLQHHKLKPFIHYNHHIRRLHNIHTFTLHQSHQISRVLNHHDHDLRRFHHHHSRHVIRRFNHHRKLQRYQLQKRWVKFHQRQNRRFHRHDSLLREQMHKRLIRSNHHLHIRRFHYLHHHHFSRFHLHNNMQKFHLRKHSVHAHHHHVRRLNGHKIIHRYKEQTRLIRSNHYHHVRIFHQQHKLWKKQQHKLWIHHNHFHFGKFNNHHILLQHRKQKRWMKFHHRHIHKFQRHMKHKRWHKYSRFHIRMFHKHHLNHVRRFRYHRLKHGTKFHHRRFHQVQKFHHGHKNVHRFHHHRFHFTGMFRHHRHKYMRKFHYHRHHHERKFRHHRHKNVGRFHHHRHHHVRRFRRHRRKHIHRFHHHRHHHVRRFRHHRHKHVGRFHHHRHHHVRRFRHHRHKHIHRFHHHHHHHVRRFRHHTHKHRRRFHHHRRHYVRRFRHHRHKHMHRFHFHRHHHVKMFRHHRHKHIRRFQNHRHHRVRRYLRHLRKQVRMFKYHGHHHLKRFLHQRHKYVRTFHHLRFHRFHQQQRLWKHQLEKHWVLHHHKHIRSFNRRNNFWKHQLGKQWIQYGNETFLTHHSQHLNRNLQHRFLNFKKQLRHGNHRNLNKHHRYHRRLNRHHRNFGHFKEHGHFHRHVGSHSTVDRHNFDGEWHLSRHKHQSHKHKMQEITEHGESSDLTIDGHYFKRFHQLGIRLIGRGIVYHANFYKIRCSERRLYISMKKCLRTYGGLSVCFPRLYGRRLIGKRHKYKRYGHGFGLGVKFVRKGIIYENSYLKYHVVRKTFIKYMTVCVNSKGRTSKCIDTLQQKGLLGTAHSYRHNKVINHSDSFKGYGHTHRELAINKMKFDREWQNARHSQHNLRHELHHNHYHHRNLRKHTHRKMHISKPSHLTIEQQRFDREWRNIRQSHHNRHNVVHHKRHLVLHHNRHHVVKRKNVHQMNLWKHRHHHIHLSSLGLKHSHLAIDKQKFDREWRQSRPEHLHESPISEHHVHSRLTISGHYFKRFHQLGVRLIGRGIVYRHYFYKLRCNERRLYISMRKCIRTYGGVEHCFPRLYARGLIGKRQDKQKFDREWKNAIHSQHNLRHVLHHNHHHVLHHNHYHHGILRKHTHRKLHISKPSHLTIDQQRFDREWRNIRQRHHNRHNVLHHKRHLVLHHNRHHVVQLNNYQQRNLWKHTHHHIHLSSLGHTHSHLATNKQRFDREWRNSRHGHLTESQITEHHVHSHLTIAGHYFKRFHQLGIRLIGRGIVYHHYFYKLRCTERRMYISMRKCIRTYGGIDHCFPRLYARGLIGRRHKYKRYGHGFGLGVKFVRKGIIYENSYLKYHVVRKTFIKYMTVCVNSKGRTSKCINKLQKNGLLGTAHSYEHHKVISHSENFEENGHSHLHSAIDKQKFDREWRNSKHRHHNRRHVLHHNRHRVVHQNRHHVLHHSRHHVVHSHLSNMHSQLAIDKQRFDREWRQSRHRHHNRHHVVHHTGHHVVHRNLGHQHSHLEIDKEKFDREWRQSRHYSHHHVLHQNGHHVLHHNRHRVLHHNRHHVLHHNRNHVVHSHLSNMHSQLAIDKQRFDREWRQSRHRHQNRHHVVHHTGHHVVHHNLGHKRSHLTIDQQRFDREWRNSRHSHHNRHNVVHHKRTHVVHHNRHHVVHSNRHHVLHLNRHHVMHHNRHHVIHHSRHHVAHYNRGHKRSHLAIDKQRFDREWRNSRHRHFNRHHVIHRNRHHEVHHNRHHVVHHSRRHVSHHNRHHVLHHNRRHHSRHHVVHHSRHHVVHPNRHHVVHHNRHHGVHHYRHLGVHHNRHHVVHHNRRHVTHHNRHHVLHHNRRHHSRHHVVYHSRHHVVHHNRHHEVHHNRHHGVHHNRHHVVHHSRRHVTHHNRHHVLHHNRRRHIRHYVVHHSRHHVVHHNRHHVVNHNRHHGVHHYRHLGVHHNRHHVVHHNRRHVTHHNRHHVLHHNRRHRNRHHGVHHNRHHVVHHNRRHVTHHNRHHVVHHNLVHRRSRLAIDKQRFDRKWQNSRHGHLHESQIKEHHESSGLTIAGHYFKRFHQLGVRLIGRGIVYHHSFYKLRCSERRLYISMRKCIRTYGGVEHCFPRLYGRGLIGKRHQYKKYGHGFGLGVKFVRKGIVYENYYLKYHVVRKTFIKYMTVCVNSKGRTSKCINKLQKTGLLGVAHAHGNQRLISQNFALKHEFLHHTSVSSRKQFLHHKAGYRHIHAIKVDKRIFRRYRKLGVRLVGKGILVNGYFYRIRVEYTIVYIILRSCLRSHGGVYACLPVLYKKSLIGRRHRFVKYGRGYGLGIKFVRRGIVYKKYFYKFLIRRRRFIRYMTTCIHNYHKTGVCLTQLRKQGIIQHAVTWRRKQHRVASRHLFSHRRSSNYGHSHNIKVDKRIFRLYRKLGVHLVGQGITYHGYFYRFSLDYSVFYTTLRSCKRTHGGMRSCLQYLHKKELIGVGHRFRKYNRGYGLGIKFVRRGIVYQKHFYKFLIRRRRFVRYMTTCIHNYHKTGVCLYHLHKQGIIEHGVTWKGNHLHHRVASEHIVLHSRTSHYGHSHDIRVDKRIFRLYRKLGVHLVGKGITFHGYFFRFSMDYNVFYKTLRSCKRTHGGMHSCLQYLHGRKLISRRHRFKKYNRGYGLGIKFVRRGIVYQQHFYKFLIRRRRFVRYMTTCIHNYHHADVCLTQLHRQEIIGNAVKWNGKHILHHVHGDHLVKHGHHRHLSSHQLILKHLRHLNHKHHLRNHLKDHHLESHHTSSHKRRTHLEEIKQRSLDKHIRHIHQSALGHGRRRVAIHGRNYNTHGHISRQTIESHTEHHESSDLVIAGHYFKRFHQLGVRLIGRGIVYHKNFYKLRCSERRLYISMKKCIRTYGGVEHCFPRLYERGLIGKRHRYKRYGRGFGLGVKFVRKGIVYENYYLKYHVVRKTFIKYMTVCVNSKGRTSKCIDKLQNNGLLGNAHSFEVHKTISRNFSTKHQFVHHSSGVGHIHDIKVDRQSFRRYRKLGVRLVGQGILFKGYFYRIRVDYTIVYKTLLSCMRRTHDGVGACLPILFKKSLIGKHHRFRKYGQGYGLGIKFVRRGVVYKEHFYKFLIRRKRFIRYMTTCLHIYHHTDVCVIQLQKQRILNHAVPWRGKHMFPRVTSQHLVSHRSPSRYGHVHDIRVNKRIFRLYRKLGVRLVGQGILYHRYFYKIRVEYTSFYRTLRLCTRANGGVRSCLPQLYKKHLIGKRHRFKKFGRGYGLGIKFVRRGIVYRKHFFKFLIRRRRFVRYMTTCIHKYKHPDVCVTQLQKQGILAHASIQRKHHGHHRKLIKVTHRRFSYDGHVYRLTCRRRRFYNKWSRCMRMFHNKDICFRKLHSLFILYSEGHEHDASGHTSSKIVVSPIFKRFRKLGVSLVGRGILYHSYYYKLRCEYTKFYTILRQCERSHGGANVCISRMFRRKLIGRRHKFKRFGKGFGLGVKFIRKGVVYKHSFYKFLIRRRLFIRYMTTCYNEYGNTKSCIAQLGKQGIIGAAHAYKEVTKHSMSLTTLLHGTNPNAHHFVYKGSAFKLRCSVKRFYRLWRRCMRKHNNVFVCFSRLHGLFKPKELDGDDKSTQGIIGYGGIKMVNGKNNVAHEVIGDNDDIDTDDSVGHHRHSHVTHRHIHRRSLTPGGIL